MPETLSLDEVFGQDEKTSTYNRNSKYAKLAPNGNYLTNLSPDEESSFQKWVKDNNIPFDPSSTADYDMRGFYKALKEGRPEAQTGINSNDNQLHFSDYFKTPYHKSFSAESKFANENAPRWNDQDQLVTSDGKIVFDEKEEVKNQKVKSGKAKVVTLSLDEVIPQSTSETAKSKPSKLSEVIDTLTSINNSFANFAENEVIDPALKYAASFFLTDEAQKSLGIKPSNVIPNFLEKAGKTVDKTVESVGTDILLEGNLDRPVTGAVKAFTAGGAGLLETANTGINFLYNMAKGQAPRKAFEAAKETEASGLQVKDLVEGLTKVNLSPKNETEAALQGFLNLIPESVFAVGEDAYQKTGSVVLAAGVEATGTLLTLKPSIAGKILKSAPLAVEGLAVKNPKAVKQLAEHVSEADPTLAKEMNKQVEKAGKLTPEQEATLGEKIVEAGFRKVGETPEGKPRIRVVQKEPVKELTPEEQVARDTADQTKIEQGLTQVAVELTDSAKTSYMESLYERAKALLNEGTAGAVSRLKEALKIDTETATGLLKKFQEENKKPAPQENYNRSAKTEAAAKKTEPESVTTFKTAKGSLYTLDEAGKTTRDKAARDTPGHEGDSGLKPASDKTIYLETNSAALSAAGISGLASKGARVIIKDGKATLLTWNEAAGKWGVSASSKDIPFTTEPGLGKYPLELWRLESDVPGYEAYSKMHAGNQIVEISKGEKKSTVEKAEVESDPVLFRSDTGEAITESKVREDFTIYKSSIPIPGAEFIVGKLKGYLNEIQRLVAPETLGPKAKSAAAAIARRVAEALRSDVWHTEKSKGRRTFWEKTEIEITDFLDRFEKGLPQKTPLLQTIADSYKLWNENIFLAERQAGIVYEGVTNYIYHVFEPGSGVEAFFESKYGTKWHDPAFMKDRIFQMYKEAIDAGFKPKWKNPEDIMLARQHASDIALMKINTLKDLADWGLAKEITEKSKGTPTGWNRAVQWRAPNGRRYWVHEHAAQILHNAFETKSLWTIPGVLGDAFRGAMFLKNTIVSAMLSVSGYHALHVLTLDNAAAMTRYSKEVAAGRTSPLTWLAKFIEQNLYGSDFIPFKALYDNPAYGGRLIKLYEGKLDPAKASPAEIQLMSYMMEGGFIPHLSAQYKTQAIASLKQAIKDKSAKAAWYLPFSIIQVLQKPMMEIWIPRLKAASYAKDIQSALKIDPALVHDVQRRTELFRQLAKSVDNRYGEMAYNTLFWNRMVKDLGVANTLSLGWQLGFLREYGGAVMDVGQVIKPGSSITQKVQAGKLDRPLFVSLYTTQTLMYGGLMTYLFTQQMPETLEDYIFPKNGETNPDGTPQRVNTMYYVKEFASIVKRMQIEGAVGGLKHIVESKASGVVGAVSEWANGLNSMGQEIRDPNAEAHLKVRQTLAYTLGRLEPISIKAVRESDRSVKSTIMGVAGFSPAPKYIAESVMEGKIKAAYTKYNTAKLVPYDKFQLSKDKKELQRLYDAGDMDGFDEGLDAAVEKFKLTAKEEQKLINSIANKNPSEGFLTMFKSLPWQKQKALLDQMTEEERDIYLPVSNKDHLRFEYEPPVKEQ